MKIGRPAGTIIDPGQQRHLCLREACSEQDVLHDKGRTCRLLGPREIVVATHGFGSASSDGSQCSFRFVQATRSSRPAIVRGTGGSHAKRCGRGGGGARTSWVAGGGHGRVGRSGRSPVLSRLSCLRRRRRLRGATPSTSHGQSSAPTLSHDAADPRAPAKRLLPVGQTSAVDDAQQ